VGAGAEGQPRVEAQHGRAGVGSCHVAGADPEALTEAQRLEVLQPFALPDPLVQRDVGLDAVDDGLVQRDAHACDRRGAVRAVGDQLADHRIVVRRNR
jgi:hypothetical protein